MRFGLNYIRPTSKDIKHKTHLCEVVPRARDYKCESHGMYMRCKTCKTEGGEMKDRARLQWLINCHTRDGAQSPCQSVVTKHKENSFCWKDLCLIGPPFSSLCLLPSVDNR